MFRGPKTGTPCEMAEVTDGPIGIQLTKASHMSCKFSPLSEFLLTATPIPLILHGSSPPQLLSPMFLPRQQYRSLLLGYCCCQYATAVLSSATPVGFGSSCLPRRSLVLKVGGHGAHRSGEHAAHAFRHAGERVEGCRQACLRGGETLPLQQTVENRCNPNVGGSGMASAN